MNRGIFPKAERISGKEIYFVRSIVCNPVYVLLFKRHGRKCSGKRFYLLCDTIHHVDFSICCQLKSGAAIFNEKMIGIVFSQLNYFIILQVVSLTGKE